MTKLSKENIEISITATIKVDVEELVEELIKDPIFIECFLSKVETSALTGSHLTIPLLLNCRIHHSACDVITDMFRNEFPSGASDDDYFLWINNHLPLKPCLPEPILIDNKLKENWSADPITCSLQLVRQWIRNRSGDRTEEQWIRVYEWICEDATEQINH